MWSNSGSLPASGSDATVGRLQDEDAGRSEATENLFQQHPLFAVPFHSLFPFPLATRRASVPCPCCSSEWRENTSVPTRALKHAWCLGLSEGLLTGMIFRSHVAPPMCDGGQGHVGVHSIGMPRCTPGLIHVRAGLRRGGQLPIPPCRQGVDPLLLSYFSLPLYVCAKL